MNNIYYGRQHIDLKDIKIVSDALRSDLITTGSYVKKFENQISKFLKVKFSVTCNSGTSGLLLSFMSIGLKKDDVIIMPIVNFVASYNMARFLGAKVFFADIDACSGQVTPQTIEQCIKINNLKKIKAIVTMYMGGYSQNEKEFFKIKKKYKCYLIEDACHAFGSSYTIKSSQIKIGSCAHSDLAVFSLHPLKTLTTGEGGIICTNNKKIYDNLIMLRSHGIEKDKNCHWKYNVILHGFNFRLSDINCALGISQLKKINKFIVKRKRIYQIYKNYFAQYKEVINIFEYKEYTKPCFHLVLARINFEKLRINKEHLLKILVKKKILCQYHYIPLYKFKIVKKNTYLKKYDFPNSINFERNTLSLPIFYDLSDRQQEYVIESLKDIILDNLRN